MSPALDHLGYLATLAALDEGRLEKVSADIALMESRLKDLTASLDSAKAFANVLSKSIAANHQVITEECELNGWPLPQPEPPAAPTPIAAGITPETTRTLTHGFPMVKVAEPVTGENGAWVCRNDGGELIHKDDVWLHAATDRNTCPQAEETRDDDLLIAGANKVAHLGGAVSDGDA